MTKEEAQQRPIEVNYPEFACRKCGKITNDANHYILKDHTVCFNCEFFFKKIEEYKAGKILIIDGAAYSDGGYRESVRHSWELGFGGREFYYRKFTDPEDQFTRTNNMWGCGFIPEHFKDELPDNAEFRDRKEWVQVGSQLALANVIESPTAK